MQLKFKYKNIYVLISSFMHLWNDIMLWIANVLNFFFEFLLKFVNFIKYMLNKRNNRYIETKLKHGTEKKQLYFRKRVCGVLKILSYQARLQYDGRCVLRGCMPKDMEREMNKQYNSHLFDQFVIIENKLQTFAFI